MSELKTHRMRHRALDVESAKVEELEERAQERAAQRDELRRRVLGIPNV